MAMTGPVAMAMALRRITTTAARHSYSYSNYNYCYNYYSNHMRLTALSLRSLRHSRHSSGTTAVTAPLVKSTTHTSTATAASDVLVSDSDGDSSSNTSVSLNSDDDLDLDLEIPTEKHLSSLEALLDLRQIDNDTFVNKSDLFVPYRGRGLFGGTMAAQAVLAALYYSNNLENTWKPISIHCHFLHAAQVHPQLYYKVIPLKSSKNYSTVEVELSQNDKVIFKATVSLQSISLKGSAANMDGQLNHHSNAPVVGKDIKEPDEMLSQEELFKIWSKKAMNKPHLQYLKGPHCEEDVIATYNREPFIWKLPLDMFDQDFVSDEERLTSASDRVLRYWLKSKDRLRNPSIFNYVAIAYISDYFFLSANMRLNLHEMFTTKFSVSLDHTIYFSDAIDTHEYFNYNIKNMRAGENRSIMFGEIFNREGKLAATTIQEGLSVVYTD